MRRRNLGLLAAAPLLAACMNGRIYHHTREPLDTNFDRTPVWNGSDQTGAGDVHHLHVPLSNVDVDVMWKSRAIGDIARRHGIAEICYADFETFSILGVWNEYTVHIYGKHAPE